MSVYRLCIRNITTIKLNNCLLTRIRLTLSGFTEVRSQLLPESHFPRGDRRLSRRVDWDTSSRMSGVVKKC